MWYCCSLCMGWERISRHRVFQKGMNLLRTESRDNEGTSSTEANLRTDQGETSSQFLWLLNWLLRLVANFYSLKTKEIPTGRVALGDWLWRVFLFSLGSGGCPFLDKEGSWQWLPWGSVSSRDDLGVGLCLWGHGTRSHTCDPGVELCRYQYIYTVEYYSALKKGNLAICKNINAPGGHYAKWNKLETEGQILQGYTYMQFKAVKLIKAKNRTASARDWGEGSGGTAGVVTHGG